jgi:hypothetical protein
MKPFSELFEIGIYSFRKVGKTIDNDVFYLCVENHFKIFGILDYAKMTNFYDYFEMIFHVGPV